MLLDEPASIKMSSPAMPVAAEPAGLVPMKFPAITLPPADESTIPLPPVPLLCGREVSNHQSANRAGAGRDDQPVGSAAGVRAVDLDVEHGIIAQAGPVGIGRCAGLTVAVDDDGTGDRWQRRGQRDVVKRPFQWQEC